MGDFAEQLSHARERGGAFLVPEGIRLRLSGADAFRYLNGQITRDLKRLPDGEALRACLLTAKGKLSAVVAITRDGGDLIVEAEASLGEALRERLERYLVADDVEILSEPWRPRLHLFAGEGQELPAGVDSGVSLARLGVPGRDVPVDDAVSAGLADSLVVEILRIERGVPAWGRELDSETLPPEAGLDRTHIDYDRGCYPGQEVISRLKSIGRVNRLLHGFRGEALASGAVILSDEGREIGAITSAASLSGCRESVALGYLQRGTAGAAKGLLVRHPLTGEKTPISITDTFAA